MVFESIVAYLIDKYLSDYIENIDTSKLHVGIWSGDIVLENLKIKSNALDDLNLPFTVVHGTLRRLKLSIPWKSLYTQSVKCNIEGLLLLAAPKSSIKYDANKEAKLQQEAKMNEVRRLTELEKSQTNEQKGDSLKDQQQDSFTERLQMQIIRNLELNIEDVHIRFEDSYTKPDHPFSLGITLQSIQLKTADENWQPTYLKENKTIINKLILLNSLSIYCNSDENKFYSLLNESQMFNLMDLIAKDNNIHPSLNYILNPLSMITKTVLNMKPASDNFKLPMFDVSILLDSVLFNLNRLQYFDIIDMLNTISFMELNFKFKKYRPIQIGHMNSRQLWKYAQTCVLETFVRPKYNQFKWEHIKTITQTRKKYTELYKRKLMGHKMTQVDGDNEKYYEEVLDVFNIMLARKTAEFEAAKKAQENKSQSWWSWLGMSDNGGEASQEDKTKKAQVEKLTNEEKAKLYEAIGYAGEESYLQYPREYVNMIIRFNLNKFNVALFDGEYKTKNRSIWIANSSVMTLKLERMKMQFERRPASDSFKVLSSVENISLTGFALDNSQSVPVLIEPQKSEDRFLDLSYEHRPLDGLCSKRVYLISKSLRCVYHTVTVKNLTKFFKSPISIERKQIKNVAFKTISKARSRTLTYMKNNLDKIPQTDVTIDIKPSYLILPEDGILTEKSRLICIDFGHLIIDCKPNLEPQNLSNSASSESLSSIDKPLKESTDKISKIITTPFKNASLEETEKIIKGSYWKFNVNLSKVQIVLCESESLLLRQHKCDDQLSHLLNPLDVYLSVFKCAYSDDVNLPSMRISGGLPSLLVTVSDSKLKNALKILTSIHTSDTNEQTEIMSQISSDTFDIDSGIDEEMFLEEIQSLNTSKFINQKVEDVVVDVRQSVNMELEFEIKEITIKISEDEKKYFDTITLRLKSIGALVAMKSYDIQANIYLNYVAMEYSLFNDLDGSKLFFLRSLTNQKDSSDDLFLEQNRLIDVKVIKTDESSPTLQYHNNTLLFAEIKFQSINFVLHQQAFENILKFIKKLSSEIQPSEKLTAEPSQTHKEEVSQTITKKRTDSLDDNSFEQYLAINGKKYQNYNQNLVLFKINAKMNEVKARLCNHQTDLFQISVNNFETNYESRHFYNYLNLTLQQIGIKDIRQGVYFENLLGLQENQEKLIDINMRLFNGNKKKRAIMNYLNTDFYDIELVVKISKLNCLFLYQHVNIILDFVKSLSLSDEKEPQIIGSTQDESININPNDYSTFKTKLDIQINAPLIIIPVSTSSREALLLDCGSIRINTSFYDLENQQQISKYKKPIVEQQKVSLAEIKLLRIILNNDLSIQSQLALMDCSELVIKIERALFSSKIQLKDNVPVRISSNYDGFNIHLSRGDYSFLMIILQEFTSDSDEQPNFVIREPDLQETEIQVERTYPKCVEKLSETEDKKQLLVNFSIKSINAYLYLEDTEMKSQVVTRKTAFSKLEFSEMKLNLTKYEFNQRIYFLLDEIRLDDLRLKGTNPLTRLVERRRSTDLVDKPMVNVNITKKVCTNEKNKVIDVTKIFVNMSCIRVCLSIDYLMVLQEFFINGLPSGKQKASQNKTLAESKAEDDGSVTVIEVTIENPQLVLVENQIDITKSNNLFIDGQIYCSLTKHHQATDLYINLKDFILKLTGRGFVYDYLILQPAYISIDGTLAMDYKTFDLSAKELNLSVCPTMINGISALVNSAGSLMELFKEEEKVIEKPKVINELMVIKNFDYDEYWFTSGRTKKSNEVTVPIATTKVEKTHVKIHLASVSIKFEADVTEQLPLIGIHFDFDGKLEMIGEEFDLFSNLGLEAAYFNETLTVWEPIIELNEIYEDILKPWRVKLNIRKNDTNKLTGSKSNLSGANLKSTNLTKMIFRLNSDMPLQLVFTKTFYNLVMSLNKIFSIEKEEASSLVSPIIAKPNDLTSMLSREGSLEFMPSDLIEEDSATILIKNDLGTKACLTAIKGFKFFNTNNNVRIQQNSESLENYNTRIDLFYTDTICLEDTQYSPVILTESIQTFVSSSDDTKQRLNFSLKFDSYDQATNFTISKCGLIGYYYNNNLILCETIAQADKKRICLRSQVKITNSLDFNIELYFDNQRNNLINLKSGSHIFVPIEYVKIGQVKVRPLYSNRLYHEHTIEWLKQANRLLQFDDIYIQFKVEKEAFLVENSKINDVEYIYNVTLNPFITIFNYLPHKLAIYSNNENTIILPGESSCILDAKQDSSLSIEIIDYFGSSLYSSLTVSKLLKQEEDSSLNFRLGPNDVIHIGLRSQLKDDCLIYTFYAPYWVFNKTTLNLEYRFSNDNDIHLIDDKCNNTPLFLKCNSKFYSNKKTKIICRVKNSSYWSDNIPIDVVGSTGTIICPDGDKNFEITIDIKLSTNGFTKIITLTPYYIIINKSELNFEVAQLNGDSKWIDIQPKSVIPFWPKKGNSQIKDSMVLRSKETRKNSKPFWFNHKHSTSIKFDISDNVDSIQIDCVPSESMIKIIFSPFSYGHANALIVNRLKSHSITLQESNEVDRFELKPKNMLLYSWNNPTGTREITWSCGMLKNQKLSVDTLISKSNYFISDSDTDQIYVLVFLDGLQKVIMFVDDLYNLNEDVLGANSIEGLDFILNLSGIGLSLVDNIAKKELSFITISSNHQVWGEIYKDGSFLPFTNDQNKTIEESIKDQRKKSLDQQFNFDLTTKIFTRDSRKGIMDKRLAPAISLVYFHSDRQSTLHLILHKIQIDNQLDNTVFPVMFGKVLPPKSLRLDGYKPLIELSMVQSNHLKSNIREIKYFKALVQEFFIKLDQGIVNSLILFFGQKVNLKHGQQVDSQTFSKELFDMKKSLFELTYEDHKNKTDDLIYYHLFHVSPIKLHLSFSMLDQGAQRNRLILDNPYLQSIGAAITDIQDAVFKLGYYETRDTVKTWSSLSDDAVNHYKRQVIRQAYILLFGLDILGNPYGLIRGLQEGVESLFYEPYAGLVQGPGEFIEGIGLGVRSLVGHTIGGAAETLSKLTGTLGKGLATLTFDDEYQQSRLKPSSTKEHSLETGTKSLLKGFVSGLGGVFSQPVQGAKEEGLGGFVKGVGKGLVGVITKPTGGIVDFATQSLEGIKKVAIQEEDIERVRPARNINADGVIRPYKRKEAESSLILREFEKGRFKNESYLCQLQVMKNPKYILMATNKSILLIKEELIFNNYKLEWSFSYPELKQAPVITSQGIQILLKKEQKNLLGERSFGKMVPTNDLNQKDVKNFVTKVTEEMKSSSDVLVEI